MSMPVVQLAGLQTEDRNTQTANIDRVPTVELCRILNREDHEVPLAVERCIPVIAEVIDTLSERVRNGGRVFYIGAGTSGSQFIALIAGGDYALRRAKEGAEDDRNGARADLQPFSLDPNVDSLIGIASSGRTPYVLGGLAYVKSLGATTVALVCVSPSAAGVEGNADYLISAVTGPEAVTGSTRMKAGTVTKLVLNMISTGIMIKLGKTYGNLMIDVKATNIKLKQRARNILRFVGGDACTQSDGELDEVLGRCHGSVKLAAATIVLNVSVADAEDRLKRNNGVLARVIEEAREKLREKESNVDDFVLCVDAGGTSCKAVIMSKGGEVGMGTAGPCNITSIGIENAIATISKAIQGAVDNCKSTTGRQIEGIKLSAAWVGMAGYGRPSLSSKTNDSLSNLLGLPVGPKLKITNDIDLLLASIAGQTSLDSVIVVVAGTGSIAMSYERIDGQFQRTHRVGGWGHLLGDDGSGYGIGREAVRAALHSSDLSNMHTRKGPTATALKLPRLSHAVFEHFKVLYPDSKPQDLLSIIVAPDQTVDGAEGGTNGTINRISGVAKIVLSMASSDDEAMRIVKAGVSSLTELISFLVHGSGVDPINSGLVLAGGMMQNQMYKTMLLAAVEAKCGRFKETKSVAQPALVGAQYMLTCIP